MGDEQLITEPWVWRRRDRIEETMTKAIWDLFDPGSDPLLAHAAAEALLGGVEAPTRTSVTSRPLWGYLSQAHGGPDLILVADNRVRVVVEHKRGARPNYTGLPLFAGSQRFDDPMARAVNPIGDSTRHGHADCDCYWHTQRGRDGLVTAGIPQIDAYRTFRRWVRPEISLDDANDVIWLLLDQKSRAAHTAFPESATAGAWHTHRIPGLHRPAVERAPAGKKGKARKIGRTGRKSDSNGVIVAARPGRRRSPW
ncbi:hypothetical protein [Actinoplanes sp. NPDC026619]|uniref:hypothetical protein n=1 Tax=Actinoplanes sp. NPDC026619 TaxID=3155798 RepID=UPI0033E24757